MKVENVQKETIGLIKEADVLLKVVSLFPLLHGLQVHPTAPAHDDNDVGDGGRKLACLLQLGESVTVERCKGCSTGRGNQDAVVV